MLRSIWETWVLVVCSLAFASLIAGCASREHMSPNHGKQSKAFWDKQQVHAEASADKPSGLDSEEAAIIRATYLKNQGRDGVCQQEEESEVLVIREPKKK